MKYVITGGAGFIGATLAKKLVAQGATICIIDDLSTGDISRLSSLIKQKKITFYKDSAAHTERLLRLAKNADGIFHLASIVGVARVLTHPDKTIIQGIASTQSVLEVARRRQIKVVISSSSEVYDYNDHLPFLESDPLSVAPTTIPRGSYAITKIAEEQLAFAYYYKYKLPITIARLFNTIGPGQSGQYGMVVQRFFERALANRPLLIYGDGKQQRCFSDVDDVTSYLITLMKARKSIGSVYNVGNDVPITISNLANKIITMTQSHSQKKFVPLLKVYGAHFNETRMRQPDLSKIRNDFPRVLTTPLETTLTKILTYYSLKNKLA